jgi:hypothetical protein
VSAEVVAELQLVTQECGACGITFGLPKGFRQECLDHPGPAGKSWWCPNGHPRHYLGKSEAQLERERADRLARKLDAANALATHERDQRYAAERSNRALRAVNTRTRKRIAAGECPCCRQPFADLAEHMAGQHPEYATAEEDQ